MSGRGQIGTRVGGKGSWRRKGKKQPHGDALEAQKVWAAAQRLINGRVFPLDNVTMLLKDQEKAKSFNKPELLCDTRANTYIIHGKAEEKPMADVLQDLISGIDFSKFKGKEEKDELNDVPADVDFSNPEGQKEEPKPEEAAEAKPEEKKE